MATWTFKNKSYSANQWTIGYFREGMKDESGGNSLSVGRYYDRSAPPIYPGSYSVADSSPLKNSNELSISMSIYNKSLVQYNTVGGNIGKIITIEKGGGDTIIYRGHDIMLYSASRVDSGTIDFVMYTPR